MKNTNTNKIYTIYKLLYDKYGVQGWWPFFDYDENAKELYAIHPNDYTYPKNEMQIFEVVLGSILTQNTTYTSVIKALMNLYDLKSLSPAKIQELDLEELKTAIKPAGYYNQKSRYILEYIKFHNALDGAVPSRKELLKVIGIGEETADSILLFGYNQAEFKVDAYTKRILQELKLIDEKTKYKDIKKLIQDSLEQITSDKEELRIIYQEFHALIVKHAQVYYSKKPYVQGCFLKENFS